jgi:hypothetical protein
MSDTRRLEDLSVEQLKAVLIAEDSALDDEQLLAIRDYVWRVGGIQHARTAAQLLATMKRAA